MDNGVNKYVWGFCCLFLGALITLAALKWQVVWIKIDTTQPAEARAGDDKKDKTKQPVFRGEDYYNPDSMESARRLARR